MIKEKSPLKERTQQMTQYKPLTDHLPKYPSNWQNLPTKAIRIPEKFSEEILDYAHQLDIGERKVFTDKATLKSFLSCNYEVMQEEINALNSQQIELFYLLLDGAERISKIKNTKPKPEERIEIGKSKVKVFFPYNQTRVKLAKTIASAFWDSKGKYWEYDLDDLRKVINFFPSFAVSNEVINLLELREKQEEEIEEKKERKIKNFQAYIKNLDLGKPINSNISLFDHQKSGVDWLLKRTKFLKKKGGILADEMGLGKTYTSLIAAKKLKEFEDIKIIIICPASLKSTWAKVAKSLSIDISIYSWAKIPLEEEKTPFLLIADEAHFAQNLQTARTKKILKLADHDHCVGFWGLTGTPLKNGRPINLFPLLKICNHLLSKDFDYYRKHFCNSTLAPWGWDDSGARNLDELRIMTGDVILRRTKKDCLDLPPKIRTLLQMEVSRLEKEEYKTAIEELRAKQQERLANQQIKSVNNLLGDLAIIRHAGSKAKIPAAIEFCKSLLEQDSSIVVFTEFVDTAKSLSESLGGCCFTGETSLKDRDLMINDFQVGKIKAFVGTIGAGGVGLTLTKANYVVLVDRPWTPGDAAQAEDRLHRIGQESTVHSYWLQLPFGLDVKIDNLLAEKKQNINTVLGEKNEEDKLKNEILNLVSLYLNSKAI